MNTEVIKEFIDKQPDEDFGDSKFTQTLKVELKQFKQLIFGHPFCDRRQQQRQTNERFSNWTKN